MYAQIEKPKEDKSRSVTNSVAQKKSDLKQGFVFVDNRPVAIVPNHVLKNRVKSDVMGISRLPKLEYNTPLQKVEDKKVIQAVFLRNALNLVHWKDMEDGKDYYQIGDKYGSIITLQDADGLTIKVKITDDVNGIAQKIDEFSTEEEIVSDIDDDKAMDLKEKLDVDLRKSASIDQKRSMRAEKLQNFGHVNSSKGLRTSGILSTSVSTEKQGCGVLMYPDAEAPQYFSMSSSMPMSEHVTKMGIVDGGNTRKVMGDGSHVHTEMFALYQLLKNQTSLEGLKAIISKQTCPVCRAVFDALGIQILDDEGIGDLPQFWTNPFKHLGEQDWYKAVSDVLQKIEAASKPFLEDE